MEVRVIFQTSHGGALSAHRVDIRGHLMYIYRQFSTSSFFFFTLVTGPRRSLSLKMSDTRVYAPQIRARLGTTAQFCRVGVVKWRDDLHVEGVVEEVVAERDVVPV